MWQSLLPLMVGTAIPAGGQETTPASPHTQQAPTWEALRARPHPQWFRDAKLGIFIHWGVYSVPAYSNDEDYAEWFLRGIQLGDTLRTRFLRENYGEGFEYRDFAPLFKAELFDPDAWAELFRRAGARYVVLVSKHHDGYALWPSRHAPAWNSMEVGPGRDLVGDLTEAVRSAGLHMGLYYSLAEWNNPLHRWYTDPPDSIGPYVEEHMIPQLRELVSTYRPTVLFADGEWLNTAEQWHARELIGWYFDTVGPDAVVNDRWGSGADIGFRTPEYSAGIEPSDRPWAEVRGLGRSFALNRKERLEAYMTPEALVRRFASAVASGGGMILNVGPAADGRIPLLQQERLLQLGSWLEVNGEAIYGSEPWIRAGEDRPATMERVDPAVDFDWVRNTPGAPIREDEFTAEWTGWLEPLYSETYTFEAEADDGMRVWVDGALVVDAWGEEGGKAARSPDGTAALVAGRKHALRVEYREDDLNASVRLFWSSPSQVREVVPRARLSTAAHGTGGDGLHAVYRSRQRYLAYTQRDGHLYAITFEWPDGELALPIPEPPADTRIRLLGLEGWLPWRYEDGAVLVDLSGIPHRNIPGNWAWTVKLESYTAPMREAR
jgi:alpha-L-fucosidase